MPVVYENIFNGNFLYGSGIVPGTRLKGRALASSLNLLPQTPLDTMPGELLADFGGTVWKDWPHISWATASRVRAVLTFRYTCT